MNSFVTPAEAIDDARRVVAARPGQTVFLGIDGCGGSGKTTFAARLAAALAGSCVIAVDDFSGPRFAEWDWDRFDQQVVQPLVAGVPACYQRWDWDRDCGAEWHEVRPGGPVIVEGVSCTRREVRAPWAWTAWVEAPRAVRLDRAFARDGAERLGLWLDHWIPSEDAYVAREQPQRRVDVLVSGITDALQVRQEAGGLVAAVGTRIAGTLEGGAGAEPVVVDEFAGHGVGRALLDFRRCQT